MHRGITLVELIATLGLLGLLASFALARIGGQLDILAVRAAASDVAGAFALARNAAIAKGTYATVFTDSSRRTVTVALGPDTLLVRPLGIVHGITIRSNRDSLAYNPIGHGYGASNQTVVLSRGAAIDSVVVSRLGRVRYRP
jgi:prepilin-type N-terminal cleavage/methylation domain-containing protein